MSIVRKIADLPRAAVVAAGDQFTIWRNGRTYQADLSLILAYIGLIAKGDKGDKGDQGNPGPQGIPGQKGDKGDTTANFDVTPLTATGTPTGRLLPDRAADFLNVKDFGAKLDGTDDSLAYQAARAAAPRNGVISVPKGQFVAGVPADKNKTVLWKLSGNSLGNSQVPAYQIGSDIVETFLPDNGGKYISRGQTTSNSRPMFTCRQDVSHSGGTGGVLTTGATYTDVATGSVPNAFVWGQLNVFYDHSIIIGGNNVACYNQWTRMEPTTYNPANGLDRGELVTATAFENIPYGAQVNTYETGGVYIARLATNLNRKGDGEEATRPLTSQGVAIAAASAGSPVQIARRGLVGGFPGLLDGQVVYLGDAPGSFTSIKPTPLQTDRFVQNVGVGRLATIDGVTAVYLEIKLIGKTPGWALLAECTDRSGRPSSETGPMVTQEIDVFGSNFDDADIRYGLDVAVGRTNPAAGGIMEAAGAIRVSSVYQKGYHEVQESYFKVGVIVDSGILEAAFDGSKAVFKGQPVVLRTGVGNMIDFSSDASRRLRYTTGKLVYSNLTSSLFEVGDDGQVYAYGRVNVPAFNIPDAQAPTSTADTRGDTGDVIFNAQYMYRKTTSGWLRSAAYTTF